MRSAKCTQHCEQSFSTIVVNWKRDKEMMQVHVFVVECQQHKRIPHTFIFVLFSKQKPKKKIRWCHPFLTRFKQQNGYLTQVKVDEMFGFVCDVTAKVTANNAVPCWVVLFIKFLLAVTVWIKFRRKTTKNTVREHTSHKNNDSNIEQQTTNNEQRTTRTTAGRILLQTRVFLHKSCDVFFDVIFF